MSLYSNHHAPQEAFLTLKVLLQDVHRKLVERSHHLGGLLLIPWWRHYCGCSGGAPICCISLIIVPSYQNTIVPSEFFFDASIHLLYAISNTTFGLLTYPGIFLSMAFIVRIPALLHHVLRSSTLPLELNPAASKSWISLYFHFFTSTPCTSRMPSISGGTVLPSRNFGGCLALKACELVQSA
jgi:hypothetical protein